MDMKYKDGSSNTDDQIVGLLIALLFAGQHSSTTVSTWTTILSARYRTLALTKFVVTLLFLVAVAVAVAIAVVFTS